MTITLTPRISAFPVRHGKAVFAMQLRDLLWKERFAALAFALPASLRDEALEGVEHLPLIRALVVRVGGTVRAYLPFDPCDAYVEALRQARQRRLPVSFLEDDALLEGPGLASLPDAYLAKGLGTEAYYRLAKEVLARDGIEGGAEAGERLDRRAHRVYRGLRALERSTKAGGGGADAGRILLLCDFALLVRLEALFAEESIPGMLAAAEAAGAEAAEAGAADAGMASRGGFRSEDVTVRAYPVKPGLLFFALGEPPFFAGAMEKERADVLAAPKDYLDLVKGVFVETRNHFLEGRDEAGAVSVKKIQAALTYMRNLAIQQGRLTPDLMDMITAAKGVFGNAFAAKVLEAARYYPFFDPAGVAPGGEAPGGEAPDSEAAGGGGAALEIGRDHIREPGEAEPAEAFNLLEDEPKVWKTVRLKKEPDKRKQRRYRYSWDPRGMCSHLPEDTRIEGFNRTVRRRSRDVLEGAFARTEKLTASLKDGIDVRETLRNWTSGGIYVREIPPSRGRVDTVVIIFDDGNDARYPQRTTWYAEHAEESTLTFYATDPFGKLIGPGIAESEYGGLSLLFPPRPVRNVFELPAEEFGFRGLAEQLVYGALLNSAERNVAYVADRRPGLRLRRMAAGLKRRLVWVPLAAFSAETLRRLRKFHILNGKDVRAWATRYIPE